MKSTRFLPLIFAGCLALGGPVAVASAAPATPLGLSVTVTACNTAAVSWLAGPSPDAPLYAFKLFRNGAFLKWVRVPSTSTSDRTITGSSSYGYAVVAVDVNGTESPMTGVVNVTTPPCADATAPSVPTGLTASTVSCSAIALSWTAATDSGGSGLRGYNVYRDGAFVQHVAAPAITFTNSSLAASTGYSYAVSAVDNAGNESARCSPVTRSTSSCTNLGPQANAGPDLFTQSLTPLSFDGSRSSDPDDGIASYSWNFGDGGTGNGAGVSHAFAHPGTYTATLTVTDKGGLSASDTAVVTVANRPPVAQVGPAMQVKVGTDAAFSGAASYDPDGRVVSYRWTFGDGGSATTGTATHRYATAGAYRAMLTVTDDLGAQGNTTCLVTATAGDPSNASTPWAQRLGGAGTDIGQAVALAADGSAVVAGRVSGTGSAQLLLAKYSPTGTALWTRSSNGTGSGEAYGVAVDPTGDVLVAGWLTGSIDLGTGTLTSAGSTDFFVAKYAGADGRPLWARRFGGAVSDIAYGIAVDGRGDVILTGFFQRAADLGGGTVNAVLGGVDTFVAKYAGSDGHHLWSRDVGDASDDIGYGVAVDGNGDAVITGFFRSRMNFGSTLLTSVAASNDVFLAKVRGADGQTVWARSMGGTLADRGQRVAVDGQGDILLTGFFQGAADLGTGAVVAAGGSDAFVAKYAGATGAPVWARGLGGAADDLGLGVAADEDGNAVVTGRFRGTADFGGAPLTSPGDNDVVVAKYAAATGAHVWSMRFGGVGADMGNSVAATGGRVVVAGSFQASVDFDGTVLTSADTDLFLLNLVP